MKTFLNTFNNWLNVTEAYAQDLIPCPDGTQADPAIGCVETPASVVASDTSAMELVLKIASILMTVVAAAAVIMLIVGGITYSLSAGDEDKMQKAKSMMFWSVIGLIVALIARFVAQAVIGVVA